MALRTIILAPGECATIPSTATVESIVIDGSISVSSECDNLPDPTTYQCWMFNWEESDDGALQDAYFESLTIGSNVYNVPSAYNPYNNDNALIPTPDYELKLADWLDNDQQFTGLVKLGCNDGLGDFTLKIEIPSGLPAPILKIVNPYASTTQVLYMHAVEDADCENC